jgi:hypothetical protein
MGKVSLLHDFQAQKIHETDSAVLLQVWVIPEGEKNVWFPKSAVQDNEDGTYTCSEYWAQEKGLI